MAIKTNRNLLYLLLLSKVANNISEPAGNIVAARNADKNKIIKSNILCNLKLISYQFI